MGATVKCTVTGAARPVPATGTTPPAPPGTVRVMVVPGGKVAAGSNCTMAGESRTHEPATAGSSLGIGLVGASGAENPTVTGSSGGTSCWPSVGTVEVTCSAGSAGTAPDGPSVGRPGAALPVSARAPEVTRSPLAATVAASTDGRAAAGARVEDPSTVTMVEDSCVRT